MSAAFEGKTIVITGAGAGIGRALAMKLLQRGAKVWALDLNADGLASLADEAGKFGLALATRVVDVSARGELETARDAVILADKAIDYWINNAGIVRMGDFIEVGLDDFDKVVAVNLLGVVNGTRVAMEAMENAGRGRIVNMASLAGLLPAPYMTSYVATKHAVVGFTRALSEELRLKGSPLSLLLVCPGFVDTQIIGRGQKMGFPEWLSFLLAKPDDVAESIVKALPGKRAEIFPTMNGKLMRRMYSILPRVTVNSSKILMTQSLKDVMLRRYTR